MHHGTQPAAKADWSTLAYQASTAAGHRMSSAPLCSRKQPRCVTCSTQCAGLKGISPPQWCCHMVQAVAVVMLSEEQVRAATAASA